MKKEKLLELLGHAHRIVDGYSDGEIISRRELWKISRLISDRPFDYDGLEESYLFNRHLQGRFDKIDRHLENISERAHTNYCRYGSQENAAGDYIHLVTTGGLSPAAMEQGKAEVVEEIEKWLHKAVEVILIDPYLFKRSQSGDESSQTTVSLDSKHVNMILDILGKKKKRVEFFFSGSARDHMSPGVVDVFVTETQKRKFTTTYRALRDEVHDRVWLKRDEGGPWAAKVVGTSLDGIGRRPTYVLNMPNNDIEKYFEFVDYLRSKAVTDNERPITLKPIPKNRVSNSGKTGKRKKLSEIPVIQS